MTNIVKKPVQSPEEFTRLMNTGMKNRTTGATKMNDRSSRSHLVMIIEVEQHNMWGTNTMINANHIAQFISSMIFMISFARLIMYRGDARCAPGRWVGRCPSAALFALPSLTPSIKKVFDM